MKRLKIKIGCLYFTHNLKFFYKNIIKNMCCNYNNILSIILITLETTV